ncbi:MAG: hypothetical protein H6Q14_685 [Bacteroidetes bacterium]|nr:hypothetical protein [Bacteroidota bacterium]
MNLQSNYFFNACNYDANTKRLICKMEMRQKGGNLIYLKLPPCHISFLKTAKLCFKFVFFEEFFEFFHTDRFFFDTQSRF